MSEVIKGKPWEFDRKKEKRYRKKGEKHLSKFQRKSEGVKITDGKISLYEKEIFYFQIDWKEKGSY